MTMRPSRQQQRSFLQADIATIEGFIREMKGDVFRLDVLGFEDRLESRKKELAELEALPPEVPEPYRLSEWLQAMESSVLWPPERPVDTDIPQRHWPKSPALYFGWPYIDVHVFVRTDGSACALDDGLRVGLQVLVQTPEALRSMLNEFASDKDRMAGPGKTGEP